MSFWCHFGVILSAPSACPGPVEKARLRFELPIDRWQLEIETTTTTTTATTTATTTTGWGSCCIINRWSCASFFLVTRMQIYASLCKFMQIYANFNPFPVNFAETDRANVAVVKLIELKLMAPWWEEPSVKMRREILRRCRFAMFWRFHLRRGCHLLKSILLRITRRDSLRILGILRDLAGLVRFQGRDSSRFFGILGDSSGIFRIFQDY